ncbi:hypothetical protein GCM10023354_17990 [Garicola koreensis]|uniref:hypothetical protein n=1 Tax=Garicola koreensis TaxID=1262554 RepID=UPI0031EE9C3C
MRALLREEYPVAAHIAETEVPVPVIWAKHDSVVPPHLSAEVAPPTAELVERRVFEGAGHNDPVMGHDVAAVVARTSDSIES